ncbi:MAG TPA: hypothetical protein PKM20_10810, partial [Nitrosomonas sp.]|nr:hypothetical protein [Nitrosomonas sp.]
MGMSGKEEKNFLSVVRRKRFTWIVSALLLTGYLSTASALTLYVDPETNQVYTTPGENRVKLGDFEPVKKAEKAPAEKTPTEEETRVLETRIDQKMEELKAMEAR